MPNTTPAPTPATKPFLRRVLRILALAAITYTLWCIAVYFLQDRIIYPGAYASHHAGVQAAAADESHITIPKPDGTTIQGFLHIPPFARTAPVPLVVLLHGNDELAGHLRRGAINIVYRNQACAVLLAEYRGYGGTGGSPSQRGITDDLEQLLRHVLQDKRINASRLVYHGRSLGGGFACDLALRVPPRALILESTFTSISSFAARYAVPSFLCTSPLDNAAAIRQLPSTNILIIHGTADQIVPFSHAQALAQIRPDALLLQTADDHFGVPADEREYAAAIESFLVANGVLKR